MRGLLAAACCVPLAALGQAEDAVTVTATRVERPSLDVPASIDRVQAEDIRAARPQVNLSESLGRAPGIVVQNRQNYAQDLQVQSRGFGARATFGIRGIRLIADGIPASSPDGQGQAANFDLGSAERIEVLRGPFSVMYGNAAGGVINVLTESGAADPGVSGDLWLGSFRSVREAVKAGGAEGNLDWIVNASHFATDGYRDHSTAHRDQLNAKLKLDLGGGTGLTLVANSFNSPDTKDPLGLTKTQMLANPQQVVPQALQFNTRKTVGQNQGGVTLTQRAGDGILAASAYFGHRDVRQYLSQAGSAPPATTSGGVVDLDRDYGGASLRYSTEASLMGAPLGLVFGGEYERQAERRQGFVNQNGSMGALRRNEDDTVSATGLYAQGEWRFAEHWLALAGLRTSQVAFDSKDLFIIPGNGDDSGSKTYRATTPAVGLLYRLAPATSLYANYGRGFETPTFAELAYQNPPTAGLNFNLNAATSRHAEAGIKSVIGTRARVNFALYEVRTKDEIVVDQNQGGRSTFKNAGRTQRTGTELFGEALLGAGFEGTLAWTMLDATYKDSFASGTPPVTVPAGNRLPGVPRSYVYGELRWKHAGSGFSAALEALHKSKVAVNDINSEFADAYTVANLAFGFTQTTKRWRVSEFVRADNLGDKQYAGSVIVNEANGRYYEPAPGRNYWVGVRAQLSF